MRSPAPAATLDIQDANPTLSGMSTIEKKDRSHGLTKADWLRLWEDGNWRAEVVSTLYAVTTSPHAEPESRACAIGLWGKLLDLGLAPDACPDPARSFPEIVRDAQISMVRGPGLGFVLDEKVRAALADRLRGVQILVDTVIQFLNVSEVMATAKALAGGVTFGADGN